MCRDLACDAGIAFAGAFMVGMPSGPISAVTLKDDGIRDRLLVRNMDEAKRDVALARSGRLHLDDFEAIIGGGGANRRGEQPRGRDKRGAKKGARDVMKAHVIDTHIRAALMAAVRLDATPNVEWTPRETRRRPRLPPRMRHAASVAEGQARTKRIRLVVGALQFRRGIGEGREGAAANGREGIRRRRRSSPATNRSWLRR